MHSASRPNDRNTPQLPQAGAAVVTVTHRLGAFGYLAHPWLSAESAQKVSGNYGQLDLTPRSVKRKSAPIFAYVFTTVPAGWRNDGATGWHAIDIGYTFASLEQAFSNAKPEYFRAYAQAQGAQSRDPGLSAADQQLASNLEKMWVQFAASGNPNITGTVQWPAYAGSEQYLEIDLPLAANSGFSKLQQPASMRSTSERE